MDEPPSTVPRAIIAAMKLTSTTKAQPLHVQAMPRSRRLYNELLIALLLVSVALIPRISGLADFLTTDEAYHWIERTERFSAALAAGRWAETIQTGHPGVSLMWLGSLGMQLERWVIGLGWAVPPDRLGHLAWLRLVPAIFHSLALLLGYAMLGRLLRPAVALVAALLWATSPYLVAHGRLLHLDGLLTDFVTLALLAALVASQAPRPLPWLVAAGAATGLALLTKGPALISLPVLGLTLFALGQGETRRQGDKETSRRAAEASALPRSPAPPLLFHLLARLRWSIPRYLLLLAIATLVVFTLWPALWSVPGLAVSRYLDEIIGNGGRPNGDGQFFLGQPIDDPGPLFYPLANLYRLTPLELLGLIGLLISTIIASARAIQRRAQPLTPNLQQTTLLALACFIAFWSLVMVLGPKKFDRYVLPTWPALMVLAAAGLVGIADWLRRQSTIYNRQSAIVIILIAQGSLLFWYHPYYLSYYNPLLGGGRAAQQLFLIGWGEGMDQVGAYLRQRPDIANGQVISALPPTLQPFLPVPVQNVTQIDAARPNYAVVYLESIQRAAAPPIYERIRATLPLRTIAIHGIDYAQIYQLPKPFAQPVGARFGTGLAMPGVTIELRADALVLTPTWDVRGPVGGDYLLFVHIFDPSGQRVAQVAVAPGGDAHPPSGAWQVGEQISVPNAIGLPAGLAPGSYQVVAGLFDPLSGQRLALTSGPAADPARAGADAALVATVQIGE